MRRIAEHHRSLSLMMRCCDKVSADQAQEWGWVYAVFPKEEFPGALMDLAVKISQMPTQAIASQTHPDHLKTETGFWYFPVPSFPLVLKRFRPLHPVILQFSDLKDHG